MTKIDTTMTAAPAAPRRRWLAVLARAQVAELESAHRAFVRTPHQTVRAAEGGMVMLRGRIGGNGDPLNFGEATVTRCAVRVGERLGVGYALGRDRRKAELIAVFDALLQDPSQQAQLQHAVVDPLAARQQDARAAQSRAAASSKVEFFTLVRGDG